MLSPERKLAAAFAPSATQDACAENQQRPQQDQAAGLRKRTNTMNRRCDDFVELSGSGQDTAGDYDRENTRDEVCNSFHCSDHPPNSFPADLDYCTSPDCPESFTWLTLVICLYGCKGIAKVGTQNKGDKVQKLRLYAKSCSKTAYSFATSTMCVKSELIERRLDAGPGAHRPPASIRMAPAPPAAVFAGSFELFRGGVQRKIPVHLPMRRP
jgi:hypothetical protein